MKERPILFSAPMVRAILEGRKSQTRRVVKDVPGWCTDWGYTAFTPQGSISARGPFDDNVGEKFFRLRYGAVGDRLWVRETWGMSYTDIVPTGRSFVLGGTWGSPSRPNRPPCVVFRADGDMPDDSPFETARWCPSIHMPRWASRITLEITGVRVERLQEISEEDAKAEGAPDYEEGVDAPPPETDCEWSYCASFRRLWESINGAESWAANPWVWVIEFKRVQP